MKLSALLSVLILSLASCEKRVALLEGPGTLVSPDGNCEVVISSGSPGLTLTRVSQRNFFGKTTASSKASLGDWHNHPGSFVFFESNDRIWAFDGVAQSFVYKIKDEGGSVSYSFDTYPGDFPSEVISRLPESLASKYRSRAANVKSTL